MVTTQPFTPTPFPYQLHGACAAAWDGHTLIADEPGLGKTIQALLAARMMNARRILIICPPILVTNWEKETLRTRNAEHISGDIITESDRAMLEKITSRLDDDGTTLEVVKNTE